MEGGREDINHQAPELTAAMLILSLKKAAGPNYVFNHTTAFKWAVNRTLTRTQDRPSPLVSHDGEVQTSTS